MEELEEYLPRLQDIEEILKLYPPAKHIIEESLGNLENQDNLLESLLLRMWEFINTGKFSEVPGHFRQIYSICCFFLIYQKLLSRVVNFEESYELLDKAILIGSTENLYSKAEQFIEKVSKFLDKSFEKDGIIDFLEIPILEHKNLKCDVSIENCPSIDRFCSQYFLPEKPVLIKNALEHWPALTKWRDINYLYKTAGNRTIPVEIGSNYTSENWSQELLKLKTFLVHQFSSKGIENVEYLAQHDLFDQVPDLAKDFSIPEYCLLGNSENIDIKAWLGPKGTVSPLHQDPKHNILCQVFGSKKIILAAPKDTKYLYPFEGRFLNNTSSVDVENIDFEKYPLAREVEFLTLTLQEGECLYIPVKWWHFVKSLTKSFSVSFWFE
ncbi:KDM8 family protein [Megaselia abdita]